MKKMLFFLFLLLSSITFAEINTFEKWLEEEISVFSTENIPFQNKASSSLKLDKVRLRVRPLFGLEIPKLASLEIKPFIEFHWKASSP